jgi:hypothetical protein
MTRAIFKDLMQMLWLGIAAALGAVLTGYGWGPLGAFVLVAGGYTLGLLLLVAALHDTGAVWAERELRR